MVLRRPWLAALSAALVALSIQPSLANPLAAGADLVDLDLLESENGTIAKRCANPCGYYGQLCCQSGESCYTDSNNQAQCGPAGGKSAATTAAPTGSGYWAYYTSTFLETDTITSTSVYSSWVASTPAPATVHPTTPAATGTSVPVNCNWDGGESSCGDICCPSGQYCQVSGQCSPASSVSAPLRPTSSGASTAIQTSFSTTTTVPFQTPIATGQSLNVTQSSSSSGGLSGGAIAGIVIGVIAGIIILILLCLCLCFKAAWDGLLALFGLRDRKRRDSRREVIEYESYHRSGRSAGGAAAAGRNWYGGRPAPARVEQSVRRSEKRSGFGAGTVAAGLGGLAVAMGLRRKRDERRRREEEKSQISDSYYSYSDYTASSDRRTRDTRRSMSRR